MGAPSVYREPPNLGAPHLASEMWEKLHHPNQKNGISTEAVQSDRAAQWKAPRISPHRHNSVPHSSQQYRDEWVCANPQPLVILREAEDLLFFAPAQNLSLS